MIWKCNESPSEGDCWRMIPGWQGEFRSKFHQKWLRHSRAMKKIVRGWFFLPNPVYWFSQGFMICDLTVHVISYIIIVTSYIIIIMFIGFDYQKYCRMRIDLREITEVGPTGTTFFWCSPFSTDLPWFKGSLGITTFGRGPRVQAMGVHSERKKRMQTSHSYL